MKRERERERERENYKYKWTKKNRFFFLSSYTNPFTITRGGEKEGKKCQYIDPIMAGKKNRKEKTTSGIKK